MSDKITKTVTFEIEQSGDCQECKSYKQGYCPAFDCSIADNNWNQCNSCKNYLAEQKSKVYCDGCKHVAYIKSGFCAGTLSGTSHYICTIKNNQIITQPSSCQDRSE